MDIAVKNGEDRVWPLVSIRIVPHDSAKHIVPCLESVASLEYRPLEVLMVGNKSRDGSVRAARQAAGRLDLRSLILERAPRDREWEARERDALERRGPAGYWGLCEDATTRVPRGE